ncbi:hypothetical protein D3C81_1608620 [compost metagenome]
MLTLGVCKTGKFTELAIKQYSLAFLCNSMACAIIVESFTRTEGFSVTSLKRPFPFSSSSMIAVAWSIYSSTIILLTEQKCRYHNIWQEDREASNSSSGLCLLGSPRNAGSEEPSISALPSMLMRWLLS